MAPVEMVGMSLVWSSSPEVGIISLFVLLILSVTLLALCLKCRKNTGNAYDVSGAETNEDGVNGTTGTNKGANDPGSVTYTEWRDHKNMPVSTLERHGASAK